MSQKATCEAPFPLNWEPLCRVSCLSAHSHCIILLYVSGFLSLLADFHSLQVGSSANDIWCSCELEWKNKKRRRKKEKHIGIYDEEDIYFISLEQSPALLAHWQTLDAGPPTVIVLNLGPCCSHCVTRGTKAANGGRQQLPTRRGLKGSCSQQGRDINTDPVTKHEISAATQS